MTEMVSLEYIGEEEEGEGGGGEGEAIEEEAGMVLVVLRVH
jgi:hypothetical protein